MASELHTYFQHLRSSLNLSPRLADEVVREMETHAEDHLAELERQGLSREEATRTLLRGMARPRALAGEFRQAYVRPSWHDALSAAAAFLLVSALYATHLWSQPAAVLSVAAVIVGVTLYGLWQGRPTWFYPWAGLALTLLSFCGYFAFSLLESTAGPIGNGATSPVLVLGFAGAAVYFPIALVVLGSCILAASRRDWLDATLMLTPTAPVVVWLAVLHQNGGILDGAAAVAGADAALATTFFAMAVAVAVFVRVRTRTAKLGTLFATAALVLLAASTIYDAQPAPALVTGRAILLFAFLLSPAALESIVTRQLRRATFHD